MRRASARPKRNWKRLPGMTRFAVNYCFLAALDGHAIPLTEPMLQLSQAERAGCIRRHTQEEIESFLERHISASHGCVSFMNCCGRRPKAAAKNGRQSRGQRCSQKEIRGKKERRKRT